MWYVVCELETSWIRRPWPTGGCCAETNKQTKAQYRSHSSPSHFLP